jgi:hypothetical protein
MFSTIYCVKKLIYFLEIKNEKEKEETEEVPSLIIDEEKD